MKNLSIGKSMDSSEQCSTSLNISEYAKVKLSSMRCGEFSDTSITAWRHGNRQIMKKWERIKPAFRLYLDREHACLIEITKEEYEAIALPVIHS